MWLVRTSKNFISGPFNKETLCQMILSGELGSQDEVCESGQFWIFLHEREEVARQLGINLPKPPKGEDDETTETQTQTQTQTEVTERLAAQAAMVEKESDADADGDVTMMAPRTAAPAQPAQAAVVEEAPSEAVLPSADSARSLSALPADTGSPQKEETANGSTPNSGPRVVYRPMVLGEIERPSTWRLAIWMLVIAAFFIAIWMLRALRG